MVYSEEVEQKYRAIQSTLIDAKARKRLKIRDLETLGVTRAQWGRATSDPERHPSMLIMMKIANSLGYDLVLVPKGVAK